MTNTNLTPAVAAALRDAAGALYRLFPRIQP